jgi:hypothetical protein
MRASQDIAILERFTGLIACHPWYPGKEETIRECLIDFEERDAQGELTPEQKVRLLDPLLAPRR